MPAIWAAKSVGPPHRLQILGAGGIIGEDLLEFREAGGKATRVHIVKSLSKERKGWQRGGPTRHDE
jgi:hypothetical protein